MEQVLDLLLLRHASINQVLVATTDNDLPRDRDLIVLVVAKGSAGGMVVKHDSDRCLGHSSLTVLVDEALGKTKVEHREKRVDGEEERVGTRGIACNMSVGGS